MNNPIQNYEDLLQEKERLENLLKERKERIRQDFIALKQEMQPVTHVFQEVGKFTKRDKSNSLLNAGVDITTGFLLNKFVLRKAGFITNLVIPFLVKNYSSNLLEEKGPTLLQRLSLLFSKRRNGVHPEATGQVNKTVTPPAASVNGTSTPVSKPSSANNF